MSVKLFHNLLQEYQQLNSFHVLISIAFIAIISQVEIFSDTFLINSDPITFENHVHYLMIAVTLFKHQLKAKQEVVTKTALKAESEYWWPETTPSEC